MILGENVIEEIIKKKRALILIILKYYCFKNKHEKLLTLFIDKFSSNTHSLDFNLSLSKQLL